MNKLDQLLKDKVKPEDSGQLKLQPTIKKTSITATTDNKTVRSDSKTVLSKNKVVLSKRKKGKIQTHKSAFENTPALEDRLQNYIKTKKLKKSVVIRNAIAEYLDNHK